MKVADYIAKFLEEKNISHIFEVIGGMTTHLIDSISKVESISIISMHHEQAAGFAAEAFARQNSNIPGVALATSGPGATNFITAVGNCYFDSVPVVFITGQVNTYELRNNKPIRQLGFQETDIVSIVKPITKLAYQIKSIDNIGEILEDALRIAMEGRKGPVLIDIPMDIQTIEFKNTNNKRKEKQTEFQNQFKPEVEKLIKSILSAKRPLILAGGGISSSNNIKLFREFVDYFKIPVVNSLMAVDVLSSSNKFRVGLIGTYGNRWANLALDAADALLVIGSRLDIRQTGANISAFVKNKKIYQIDCDLEEFNNRVMTDNNICMGIKEFFLESLQFMEKINSYDSWLNEIYLLRRKYSDLKEHPCTDKINPNLFFNLLSSKSEKAVSFITDVGQNQIWAAQSLQLKNCQRFLTSGGMGAMGFSLPASIGAYFASKKPIVSISGDGGFQMNIQELETIAHHNLPIKMIVLNNNSLGMVRQFQETYFDKNYQATRIGYSAPNFTKIANAYGIQSKIIKKEIEIIPALKEMWRQPNLPFLLEVQIDSDINLYPKLVFNKSFSEMESYVKQDEL